MNALGPVPDDPLQRLEWTERASAVGAYRELYGIDSDTDPIGPEPVNSPEAQSAWMDAYSALMRQEASGLETLPDSSLLLRRAQYQAETAWAPPYAGKELRQVRMAQLDMASRQVRHEAEAAAAQACGDVAVATRHAGLAESARAASDFYAQRARLDEQLEAARKEWATRTAPMRLQAVQADALLRRRHPEVPLEPLTSAEPEPLPDELPAVGAHKNNRHAAVLAQRLAMFSAEMNQRTGVLVPNEDPDCEPEGEAWPDRGKPDRDAVLQSPRPLMKPTQYQREPDLEPRA